jgi:D-3-phosphoglycerate dehydrogenase
MSPPHDETVLVTSRSFSSGAVDLVGLLEGRGVEVLRGPADHDLAALKPLLSRSTAWIAGSSPVTAAHLDAAPRLRLIARYGVGVDAVDVSGAQQRGVLVTNTPGANSEAVAEHALALLFAALRNVVAGDRGVRQQNWAVSRARQLASLRVGIAGYGRIGQALGTRLQLLGAAVDAYDPMLPVEVLAATGAGPISLADLAGCDVVSLHAPGDNLLVDEEWLSGAKGLILINTARSSLVDETAVAGALRAGLLRTYAADEVGAGHGETDSPLLAGDLVDQVILTPHSAAQTVEAVDNMGCGAVDAVLAVMAGRTPDHVVRVDR